MTTTTQTVREIALDQPSSIRVFEQFGIDYCCGGRKPLAEACAAGQLEVDQVIAALEAAEKGPLPNTIDWTTLPLAALAQHITATHHAYVKRELPRLALLSAKVINRHGTTHPQLPILASRLELLTEELTMHLMKEEAVLFPYVTKLEAAITLGAPLPEKCFGTVANPIAMMMREHDDAGGLLAEIRTLTSNYTTPEGACPTWHAYFDGLREFQQDLHQHIHLENNILFPRAIALEEAAG